MAASYQWLHSRSYNKFKSQNMWFALPVIIIITITGTANFAQSSLPTAAQAWAPAAIGFLNLTAGLITTVAQFLRVSEQMEGHRASSVEYGKLARNIEVELSLPALKEIPLVWNILNNVEVILTVSSDKVLIFL